MSQILISRVVRLVAVALTLALAVLYAVETERPARETRPARVSLERAQQPPTYAITITNDTTRTVATLELITTTDFDNPQNLGSLGPGESVTTTVAANLPEGHGYLIRDWYGPLWHYGEPVPEEGLNLGQTEMSEECLPQARFTIRLGRDYCSFVRFTPVPVWQSVPHEASPTP
jgi:hypothetical protein